MKVLEHINKTLGMSLGRMVYLGVHNDSVCQDVEAQGTPHLSRKTAWKNIVSKQESSCCSI